ncbi:MAG: MBL fold metallo-hydrolase [Gammaproteobacteria bacterium]|nr:MAG: MBL fold metallo-hydrolase [Gammaproteobacteria bacterium]
MFFNKILSFLLLIFAMSFLQTVNSTTIAPPIPDYPAVKIADNSYVIYGDLNPPNPKNKGFMNNPVFIIGTDGIIVVDPGSSVQVGEMVLRAIKKISKKPVVAVFNTHEHGDHWLGNHAIVNAYPQVKIYAHDKLVKMVKNTDVGQRWVDSMMNLTDKATEGTQVVAPDKSLQDKDIIKIAGLSIKIHHHGDAHTTTDIMLEVPEKSLVILGDNVLLGRLGQMGGGSFVGNIQALQSIIKIKAKVYVPGHGKAGDVSVPKTYLEYLETLYKWTKKFYDDGISDFEMKEKIVPKLAKFKNWISFDREVGRHISIAYLQIEATDF